MSSRPRQAGSRRWAAETTVPVSSKPTDPSGGRGDVQTVVLNAAVLPAAKAQREPAEETIQSENSGPEAFPGQEAVDTTAPPYTVGLCLKNKIQGWGGAQWSNAYTRLHRAEARACSLQRTHKSRSRALTFVPSPGLMTQNS